LRTLLDRVAKRRISDGVYTTGCQEAFEKYKAEHAMYTRRCAHENHDKEEAKNHDENQDTEHMIPINARGSLCDDLPMLSLVNHQLFYDTFYDTFYLYFSAPKEDMWVRWTIRNLDFFPFLRFMQNITQSPHPIEILPNQVHVNYDDTDEGKDRVPHLRKFENVKRLIELHWLERFPLWGCLTGT
jgi:hypothetical protein